MVLAFNLNFLRRTFILKEMIKFEQAM